MENRKLSFSENRFLKATIKQYGLFADFIVIENSSLHVKEKSVIIATLYAATDFERQHDKFNYNSENMTILLESQRIWKGKVCDNYGRQIDLAEEIENNFKMVIILCERIGKIFFIYSLKVIENVFKNA